jgi:antitoxin CptB
MRGFAQRIETAKPRIAWLCHIWEPEMEMDEATLLKKLRWRCRRGMRELDQLFERYLDREWGTAPTDERDVFLRLLDCEDDKLWRWFMGYEACPDAELSALIARIRALPA